MMRTKLLHLRAATAARLLSITIVITLVACGGAPRLASGASGPSGLAAASAAWRASCPIGETGGLCVEASPPPGPRCGPADATVLRLRPRDARAARALAELERLAASGTPAEMAEARRLVAAARSERLYGLAMPADLDFGEAEREASERRFRAWIEASTGALRDAKAAWLAVVEGGGAPAVRAEAAAHVAHLYDHFGKVLTLAPLPRDVAADADATQAFCAALADQAGQLAAEADAARAFCREQADAPICAQRLE